MVTFISSLLILSVFFIPNSQLVRPEYFLVFALAYLGLIVKKWQLILPVRKELMLFNILIFLAFVTLLVQELFGGGFASKDMMIILRYVIYASAILGGVYIGGTLRNTKVLKFLLLAVALFSIFLSFVQYFNLFGANAVLIPLYSEKYEELISGGSWRRIIGTLGNANYWGLHLSICFAVFSFYAINRAKLIALPVVIVLFTCVIMTGSRTSMVSCLAIFVFLITYLFTDKTQPYRQKVRAFLGLTIVTGLLFLQYSMFTATLYESKDRFSVNNTHTLDTRIDHWSAFLGEMVEHPYQILFGRGPSKQTQVTWSDNMYLLILRDFGLLSLLVYLLLWFTFFKRMKSGYKHLRGSHGDLPTIALVAIIAFAVFNLAADAWFSVRLTIPFLTAYGFIVARSRNFYMRERDESFSNHS